jgi:hypothetical protein
VKELEEHNRILQDAQDSSEAPEAGAGTGAVTTKGLSGAADFARSAVHGTEGGNGKPGGAQVTWEDQQQGQWVGRGSSSARRQYAPPAVVAHPALGADADVRVGPPPHIHAHAPPDYFSPKGYPASSPAASPTVTRGARHAPGLDAIPAASARTGSESAVQGRGQALPTHSSRQDAQQQNPEHLPQPVWRPATSAGERRFASPDSDDGGPFELEDDYVPPSVRAHHHTWDSSASTNVAYGGGYAHDSDVHRLEVSTSPDFETEFAYAASLAADVPTPYAFQRAQRAAPAVVHRNPTGSAPRYSQVALDRRIALPERTLQQGAPDTLADRSFAVHESSYISASSSADSAGSRSFTAELDNLRTGGTIYGLRVAVAVGEGEHGLDGLGPGEGAENEYPDDFETESYDDHAAADEMAQLRSDRDAGHFYETDDEERLPRYNPDEVEDLGEARSSRSTTSDDGGSDGSGGAQEDGDEGNNVFMYDGTAAGSGLMDYQYDGSEMALEYDPAIGLDELSRLSL